MKKISAISLNSSATCNLQCEYCFVPHFKETTKLNNQLRKDILDKTIFDKIINALPKEEITHLGFWGGEPTLNLDAFCQVIDDDFLNCYFPSLDTIFFSSNFSNDYIVKNIELFINKISSLSKKINIEIQASIDGPAFIHNKNRKGSDVNQVIKNFSYIKNKYKNENVNFIVKSTIDNENIKLINNNEELFQSMLAFDNYLYTETGIHYRPTITIPGEHTKEDGIEYAKFTKKALDIGRPYLTELYSLVYSLFTRITKSRHVIYHQTLMSSYAYCSAGNSSVGIDLDGTLNFCQGTFMLNGAEELRIINTQQKEDKITQNIYKKSFAKTEEDKIRLFYVFNNLKSQLTTGKNLTKSFLKILAIDNQLSPVYRQSENMLDILTALVFASKGCQSANLLTTGSWYLTSGASAKLFGNGALENVMSYMIKEEKRNKNEF